MTLFGPAITIDRLKRLKALPDSQFTHIVVEDLDTLDTAIEIGFKPSHIHLPDEYFLNDRVELLRERQIPR